ncbi:potassium channel family protein [Sutcliffiella sp. NC1]|uniref:potassium channel family protein n=1 Tax=Sutcliffiella sp. NC1 TaxID=3004096 RepID=UPI0022DDAE52|nr:potassium channel family protein [Sutcliffiella sp. NC1]WBL14282.1 potassium channel family protein [Sutcliffiella sp. NC1]
MAKKQYRVPIYFQWIKSPIVLRILFLIIILNISFGTVIHFVEPEEFPLIFDGVWWAIVTTATLGYGDFVPVSITGRIIAIVLILIGTGFVTTYFVMLATNTVKIQNAILEGKVKYQGQDHIVIIGWNERVRETLEQLKEIVNKPMSIVLIDESLKELPIQDTPIHFIKGNSTFDHVLLEANIPKAKIVIITADQSKEEAQADMNTIITLLSVKGLNPNVYAIVEILTSAQLKNADRAGADEIIQTNMLSSYVIINSVMSNGMSNTLLKLLDQLKGSKLTFVDVKEEYLYKTYQELLNELLVQNQLVIGIKRRGETIVNPPLLTEIKEHDRLLIIKS